MIHRYRNVHVHVGCPEITRLIYNLGISVVDSGVHMQQESPAYRLRPGPHVSFQFLQAMWRWRLKKCCLSLLHDKQTKKLVLVEKKWKSVNLICSTRTQNTFLMLFSIHKLWIIFLDRNMAEITFNIKKCIRSLAHAGMREISTLLYS